MTISEAFDAYFFVTIACIIIATVAASSFALQLKWDQVAWRKIKAISVALGFTSLVLLTLNMERFWRSAAFLDYENKASEAYTNLRIDILRDQYEFCPGNTLEKRKFCNNVTDVDKTLSMIGTSRPILITIDPLSFSDYNLVRRSQAIMKNIGDINLYKPDAFLGKPWLSRDSQQYVNLWAVLILGLSFILATAESIYQMMFAIKSKDEQEKVENEAKEKSASEKRAAAAEELAAREADPTV